jgi:hypothetical protein
MILRSFGVRVAVGVLWLGVTAAVFLALDLYT